MDGLAHEPHVDEIVAAGRLGKRCLQGVRVYTLAIYKRINDLQSRLHHIPLAILADLAARSCTTNPTLF